MAEPNWFLALPLPPSARWQEATATAPSALRRFVADDLHLTLAFLGPCGQAAALEAWQALTPLKSDPIPIEAGAWRALGPPRCPSAYGVTLAQGDQALGDLLRRWQPVACQAAGRAPSSRAPLPHLTLLRPRRRDARDWIGPMRLWMAQAPLPAGIAVLQELALWTWDGERRDRLFRMEARRPLSPEDPCAAAGPLLGPGSAPSGPA